MSAGIGTMPHVTIVGGGLAGISAAIRLAERGCAIDLFDGAPRLGGKAGATQHGGDADEHGYHIFPMWYRNIWRLVDELGIGGNFIDRTDFKQVNAGDFPRWKSFENITSWRYAWRNLTSGVLPFSEAVLFFYAALDLMSQPYRYRAQLDQVTVTGFLRSRFYRTETIAEQFEELMLKGISVPTYEVSAMTMRKVMQFWVRSPEPMHRILKGNLQELWIEPLAKRLAALGVNVNLEKRLTRLVCGGGRVAHAVFGDETRDVDRILIAVPVDKFVRLLDDDLYRCAPQLAGTRNLRARPMAALNIYFTRRIEGVPVGHVNLLGSQFGLSFIDVAQSWPGLETTTLNLIASDFTTLAGLSDQEAISELMRDLRRYVPFDNGDIRRVDFQSHIDEPLFMNNVGGWAFRPDARSGIENLYLAGDYCRSEIDLVCMEGAVSTGLRAAEAIRQDLRLTSPVEVLEPRTYPRLLAVLGRYALLPVAAAAKLATLLH